MTLSHRLLLAGLTAGLLAAAGAPRAVQAQVDPTRPTFANPMAPALPQGGAPQAAAAPGGATAGFGGVMAPRAPRPAAAQTPRVSSVIVASPELSSAVIGDRVYRLGDKVPELGTLVAIDGAGVSLRSGSATRRLALWSRKAAAPARVASPPDDKGQPAAASASSVEAKE
jgi:hypothetical protein